MKQRSQLDPYREKRAPERTPEPFGNDREGDPGRPAIFVVQKHAAKNLHYDLRLEIAGTLRSWALPKGVTLDPGDKRAAFETEDHPLEYAGFEGIIPAGSYGAGAMILWDRGLFLPLDEPGHGIDHGKLLFELRGHKLRGLWTLVRTKRNAKEWLLIKKPPGWALAHGYPDVAEPAAGPPGEESILSGLTVEELRDGTTRGGEIQRELQALGAPRRPVEADAIEVMVPEERERPFSAPGWLFELAYGGLRVLAAREPDDPRLLESGGRDAGAVFPDLAGALAALPFTSLVMDGELVVLDAGGRPDPEALARRARLTAEEEVERAALGTPATLFLSDLLACEGFDLRALPLARRKRLLARILPPAGPLRYADHVEEHGEDFYREVARHGLPGVVGKRADAPYRGGPSADWIEVRAGGGQDDPRTPERAPGKRASAKGAPGSGVPTRSPSSSPGKRTRAETTPAGSAPGERASGQREPALTQLGKIFWPADGTTKGDLLAYYRSVSPWLLPYLRDRPLVLDRYPDGIEGKSFFQKSAAELPEGPLPTVPISLDGASRERDAIVCDDLASLLFLINLGTIPLHIGSSRIASIDRPDWTILDLDPKGAPFAHVIEIALAARDLCEEIGLPCFVKTSGGSGLHLLLPLGRQLVHEQSRQLAELLARVLVGRLPALATVERSIAARGGRVYVDYLQNGRGKLIAAPLSARPLPGAPVSTPLAWEEVGPGLDVKAFHLRNVPERLAGQGEDPLRPVLDLIPDLAGALERLASML